jgi:hypothetical protein
MYAVILFIVTGFIGTLLALRLMALDAEVVPTRLTVRGRIFVGLLVGLMIAAFVVFINGVWWNCDLTDSTSVCQINWGY